MQPHHPFVGEERVDTVSADPFGREGKTTAIDALRRGELSYGSFWRAYRSNLITALDQVSILLDNHETERVAITSDHGDALGEWGIYDHPAGSLHPVVTTVPWVETTATDTENYSPKIEPQSILTSDVEERLDSLGYI